MIFLRPLFLWLIIPAAMLLIFLLWKEFVRVDKRFKDEEQSLKRRRRSRWWMLFSRLLIVALLFVALATPIVERSVLGDKDPEILVLVDDSQSMSVLDTSGVDDFISSLEERVPVIVRRIGVRGDSALGDDVLGVLGAGKNILLVSDGHVQEGPSLRDVSLFASSLNATINGVVIPSLHDDAAVSILGPGKVVAEVNSTFAVRITKTADDPVPLTVLIDDVVVFDDEFEGETFVFDQSFPIGEHTIEARIAFDDHFGENNRFFKTVSAVSQPPVLYVSSKPSGVETILSSLYDVQISPSIPADLSPYYAVVLNDLPANRIGQVSELTSFLAEGNGMLAIGGSSSYDRGQYRNTVFETLLPVRVGAGTRTQGDANIIIAIDLSASTLGAVQRQGVVENGVVKIQDVRTTEQVQNLEKSLAISVVSELNPSNRVGVLGFTYPLPASSPEACSGACVVWDLSSLAGKKQQIIDRIATVDVTGGTSMSVGMVGSLEMLQGISGSRNIIFISDGVSSPDDRNQALSAARSIAAQGGTVYAVHVGEVEAGALFLQQLAQAGNGIYFKATNANRLSVLFGEPVDIDQGDAFDVFALNQFHFITQGLDLQATMYGYNQVAPKRGSQLLVTSNGGDPVLTVWNYGIGRVAAITAYDGQDIGQLMNKQNSKVISRTINWLIGDPERKASFTISVDDGRIGKPLVVNVTSDKIPTSSTFAFEPTGKNMYTASITPNELGVFSVLTASYAVNYPAELTGVGMNSRLGDELAVSGGQVFLMDQQQEIIDHIKTIQEIKKTEVVEWQWPFVAAALIIFLLEVVIRKVSERRREQKQWG